MKPKDQSNIVLPGPRNIYLYCESNEPVSLHFTAQHFSNNTAMTEHNRKSFYKHRSSLSGHLSVGVLDITCNLKATGAILYTWKFSIKNDGMYMDIVLSY